MTRETLTHAQLRSLSRPGLCLVAMALAALWSVPALAQDDELGDGPAFEFGEKAEVEAPAWAGTAGAGLIINSGNSNVIAFSGNFATSYTSGQSVFALEATGAYARTQLLTASDINGDGKLQRVEIASVPTVSVKNWAAKTRYDFFVGEITSAYGSLGGGADPIAGKESFASAQAGMSRKFIDKERHKVTAEFGYDLSYEGYVSPAGSSLQIHSARAFASYTLQLADEVGIVSSLELLTNLNEEDTPTGIAAPLRDTRAITRVAFDAKVYGNITARFGFGARYDNVPAPRPKPETELPYDGFVLGADKLDLRTEVALLVNFL